MKTHVSKTPLEGLVVLEIDCCYDERGFFMEVWHKRDFAAAGFDLEFVQEGHSRSGQKVLRGLHYQDMTAPIGKLVRCTFGRVWDVAVDLRVSSPTLGKWFGIELSAENKKQLYVPQGFAHGFATLTEFAELQYKQTGFYTPASEGALRWDDPEVAIPWPFTNPILSKRDQQGKTFKEYLKMPAFK